MKLPIDTSQIPSTVTCLTGLSSIDISKDELFLLGIFKHDVPPEHIGDNEYFYLASKVPAYVQLYEDFIEVVGGSIVNKSTDDRVMKDVSEIVGIAIGLKYSIVNFGVRSEEISKIPAPKVKAKYLDYKFTLNGKLYELETKGTTSKSIGSFVKDILNKKKSSSSAYLRFGTVAVLAKPNGAHKSKLHICDDPPRDADEYLPKDDVPWHYIYALGYLLDNKHYNKYQKFLSGKIAMDDELSNSFFATYRFRSCVYVGEFFDYRLNLDNLSKILTGRENSIDDVFRKATRIQGRTKIFIGIDKRIVALIEKGKGLRDILELDHNAELTTGPAGQRILLGSDGILLVLCPDKADAQVDNQFTETEVKRRMGHLIGFERREPDVCGMPCRSREKEGKSCEIKTYRGACHFHR